MSKLIKSFLAETPLVQNLKNAEYMEIILNPTTQLNVLITIYCGYSCIKNTIFGAIVAKLRCRVYMTQKSRATKSHPTEVADAGNRLWEHIRTARKRRRLTLEELASRYYISPMHFYRIFRAVTNQTIKSYILGRKLSQAAITLKNTDRKVVEIAIQYGFSSHELFTRNFIRMFHVTPSRYRKENIPVSLTEVMDIVHRDFRNKNTGRIVVIKLSNGKKPLGSDLKNVLLYKIKAFIYKLIHFAGDFRMKNRFCT